METIMAIIRMLSLDIDLIVRSRMLIRLSYFRTRRKQGNALVDPRLDLLDGSIFDGKSVLDIGCNSGNITISLGKPLVFHYYARGHRLIIEIFSIAKKYRPKYIHGVDIDKTLVNKAHTNLRIAYSLNNPKNENSALPIDLSLRFHYFPQSMSNMFGLIPMAVPPDYDCSHFPHNVQFETMDWTETPYQLGQPQYDTILA